jgi:hypothetical protein
MSETVGDHMNELPDRATQWVQMWLDVSSEQEASPSRPTFGHKQPSEEEDFENNGLVIKQRKLMQAYARLSPEDQKRLRMR